MLPITLNNREIALIIWIGLFSIGLLFHKPIRSSIVDLLKLLFSRAILTLFAILLFYVLVCVFFLHKIEFWDFSFFKDTVIWFFGVAFVLLINSNKANHDDNYFRKIILDNLKLMVILEFFLNLYVFDLYIEMLILPLIIFIVGLGAGAESQKKNVFIKKGTDYLLAIFGFIFMIYAIYKVSINFKSVANLETLRSFILPPILTLLIIPFIYLEALFIRYDSIYRQINYLNEDKTIRRFVKCKLFVMCNINLWKLNRFSRKVGFRRYDSKDDFRETIPIQI